MATFTRKAIAEICGISPQRIKQLFDAGIVSRNDDGSYPMAALTQYITYLNRNDQKETTFRRLLEMERHREKKRENDTAEELVAPVELLEEAIEKVKASMIPVLEKLPSMVKSHWPEMSNEQAELVKKTVADCRRGIEEMSLVFDDE